VRLIEELVWKHKLKRRQDIRKRKRSLIIGAGGAGRRIAVEIHHNPQLPYEVMGFIDDDPDLVEQDIHGISVLGTTQHLQAIIKNYGIEEIIIAIPTASGEQMRRIVEQCKKCQIEFRTLPSFYELIDGSVGTKQIREVNIEDLLGREQHTLDLGESTLYLHEATVMVTGAAGSIGSELCRQIATFNLAVLVLFDHEETNLFEIDQEIKQSFPNLTMHSIIGNIRSEVEVESAMSEYRPSTVFHAAAFKHVPLMESNQSQAVLNNVMGSKVLIDLGCQ